LKSDFTRPVPTPIGQSNKSVLRCFTEIVIVRQVLVEAAHRLIRYDTHWKSMAERLRSKGKKTCVIVAAVANRWMRWLFRQMMVAKPLDATAA
jgi:transposase